MTECRIHFKTCAQKGSKCNKRVKTHRLMQVVINLFYTNTDLKKCLRTGNTFCMMIMMI